MKKVARLRIPQDEQFVPPGVKINANSENTVRTTGRIKKPKAVFDPSDNYVPRSHRMSNGQVGPLPSPGKGAVISPTSPNTTSTRRERSLSTGSNTSNTSVSLPSDICIVCLKREPRRGGNYKNKLVSCVDCGKRVHKLCMNVDFLDSAPIRLNFKCDNCRTCGVCSGNANIAAITCAKCCRTYHFDCHTPKLSKAYQTERQWKCSKCKPVNNVAAASSNTIINNRGTNNETVMPVKIIRQIIGDNVNLMTSTNKIQESQSTSDHEQQSQDVTKLQKQSAPQQNQKTQHKPQEKLSECVKISEAPVEVDMKASAMTRRRSHSVTSSSSSSDDSDDEDYEYIEKKKRKIKTEHNNNHDDSVNINSDEKTSSNASKKSVVDLPKRETIRGWSVEQVADYIAEYFPKEANVFKDQEIDGNALLLLKRSDVVQKLPLKLGPSLRLYNLILMVQTQRANDPTLGWDCSVDTILGSTE